MDTPSEKLQNGADEMTLHLSRGGKIGLACIGFHPALSSMTWDRTKVRSGRGLVFEDGTACIAWV